MIETLTGIAAAGTVTATGMEAVTRQHFHPKPGLVAGMTTVVAVSTTVRTRTLTLHPLLLAGMTIGVAGTSSRRCWLLRRLPQDQVAMMIAVAAVAAATIIAMIPTRTPLRRPRTMIATVAAMIKHRPLALVTRMLRIHHSRLVVYPHLPQDPMITVIAIAHRIDGRGVVAAVEL